MKKQKRDLPPKTPKEELTSTAGKKPIQNIDAKNLELITAKELAALFKVSHKTVYRWNIKHELPGIRVGRSLFFPKEAVKKILLARGLNHYNKHRD